MPFNARPSVRSNEVYGLEPLLFISFPPIDHPSERGTSLESITPQDVRSRCKDGLDKLVVISSRSREPSKYINFPCIFKRGRAWGNSSLPNVEREENERKGKSRYRGTPYYSVTMDRFTALKDLKSRWYLLTHIFHIHSEFKTCTSGRS